MAEVSAAPRAARAAVKICCIASVAEARAAVAAGADAIGLVSHMPSGPGVVDESVIAEVAAALRDERVHTFLLTAQTRAHAIADQFQRLGTTTVQLVDQVEPDELERLRSLCPQARLVQVLHVRTGAAAQALELARSAAAHVDALLLDSGNPSLAVKELGGTGRTHDWAISRRVRDAVWPLPVWLAGGLNAGNAAAALAAVQPHGLDVCSGVRSDSRLDLPRLRAFIDAARDVNHTDG